MKKICYFLIIIFKKWDSPILGNPGNQVRSPNFNKARKCYFLNKRGLCLLYEKY